MRWRQQAFDNLAIFEVGFDDFINVVLVNIGVPDGFGVNHRNRPASAACSKNV